MGTCFKVKDHIENILKENNSQVKINIASNPEFLKEGRAIEDCLYPDRIVIGAENDEVFDILKDLYSSFGLYHDRFVLMDVKSSEMTKYVANAMLATRISFMNEISHICEVTGADIEQIRLGIGLDKRIGHEFIYAGCGYGGSCFPKDIRALVNIANVHGYCPLILSSVEEVNKKQKRVLSNKVVDRFGDLNGLNFGIWGISFKPDTADVREAPSLVVITSLIDKGAKIKAYDPQAIEEFKKVIDDNYLESIEFANSRYDAVKDCDGLILITEWNEFRNPDFEVLSNSLKQKVIFDGRNIYDKKIIKKGFELYQIGC